MKFYTLNETELKVLDNWVTGLSKEDYDLLLKVGTESMAQGVARGITKGVIIGGLGVMAGVGIAVTFDHFSKKQKKYKI